MPCATLHMIVAARVLEDWRKAPCRAPVAMDRPGTVEAFLHGAMAPDMGFIPGSDRLVSEAAHYLRPGDLTRRLVEGAQGPLEEAFAWGWANHVLVDMEVHPVVGRAVGERLYGDPDLRVDALEDVTTHVSLEVGLDVALLRTERLVAPPPARSLFRDPGATRHLGRALAETYGMDWSAESLLRSHRRAVGLTRWWPRALALLPLAAPGGGAGDVPERVFRTRDRRRTRGAVFRVLARLAGSESAARGFFSPEAPRPWFLDEVRGRIEACVETFQEWVDTGLEPLGNPNLETGGAAGVGRGHPATDLAQRRLEERAARQEPARSLTRG